MKLTGLKNFHSHRLRKNITDFGAKNIPLSTWTYELLSRDERLSEKATETWVVIVKSIWKVTILWSLNFHNRCSSWWMRSWIIAMKNIIWWESGRGFIQILWRTIFMSRGIHMYYSDCLLVGIYFEMNVHSICNQDRFRQFDNGRILFWLYIMHATAIKFHECTKVI